MFVYVLIILLNIHVLLYVDKPIDEDHMIAHLLNVFSVLSIIFHHNY